MSAFEEEGTLSAWEADVLPLNYTHKMLGYRRFNNQTLRRVTVEWWRNGVSSAHLFN